MELRRIGSEEVTPFNGLLEHSASGEIEAVKLT